MWQGWHLKISKVSTNNGWRLTVTFPPVASVVLTINPKHHSGTNCMENEMNSLSLSPLRRHIEDSSVQTFQKLHPATDSKRQDPSKLKNRNCFLWLFTVYLFIPPRAMRYGCHLGLKTGYNPSSLWGFVVTRTEPLAGAQVWMERWCWYRWAQRFRASLDSKAQNWRFLRN